MVNPNDKDIIETGEKPRKISPEQVEIVGMEGSAPKSNPFNGTPFEFKNVKVMSSGPMLLLIPILLPLILLLLLVLFIPLLLFGKTFARKFVIKRP